MSEERTLARDENARILPMKKSRWRQLKAGWRALSQDSREAFLYMIFLCIFSVARFGGRSANAYYMMHSLDAQLFQAPFVDDHTYYDIFDQSEVFYWLNNTFIPTFLPLETNATTGAGETSPFVGSTRALRVGRARLRLIRSANDSCSVPEAFPGIQACYAVTSGGSTEANEDFHGWEWASASALDTSSITTSNTKQSYPGSGYAIEVPGNQSAAMELLDWLYQERFLDFSGRALFLDFSAFNANVNMFSAVTALMEMLPAGRVVTSVTYRTTPLLKTRMVLGGEAGAADTAFVSLEIILLGFVLVYAAADLAGAWRHGPRRWFAGSGWRVLDALNDCVFLAAAGMRIH
ncbi:unnamed protein product, partial [Phaeothamnion confervicola]